MPPGGAVALILVLLALSAFFAGSEIAFLSVGHSRARQMREERVPGAGTLCFLQQHRSLVLSTILLGITATHYMAERLAVGYSVRLGPALGPVVAAVLMAAVVLVFCEVVPIQYAARSVERTALRSAGPVAGFSVALAPVVYLFSFVSRLLLALVGVRSRTVVPRVTEEHLMAMLDQGEAQGGIEALERRMMRGVLEFGDYTAAQIMVPRPDMVCVADDQTLREALDIGLRYHHSRLPAYHGTVDHVTGILHLKDLLLHALRDDLDGPVSAVQRPAYHVPESCPADELLRQLQRHRQMTAVVKDEFGGTAGLVTVEDLLEEIVGDIRDEYDVEEPELVELGPHEVMCKGRVSLHELQDHVLAELPTEEYESLSGLLLELLGHIPTVGESVEYGALRFTVDRMSHHRIERIRVSEAAPQSQ